MASREHNGCKFLLARYYSKGKKWKIQQQPFILTTSKNVLIGQYITSDWWKMRCDYNTNMAFVILQVKKNTDIITLEKDMNSLKNPFPSTQDVPYNIVNYDYYTASSTIINKFIDIKKDACQHPFRLRSETSGNILTIKFISDNKNKCMYMTLPSFELEI